MMHDPVYPVGLRLSGRPVLVVGGGTVALRSTSALLEAGAHVTVVAPQVTPALADLEDRGALQVRRRGYQSEDLNEAWLVLACTDDRATNATVADDAERARVWCVRRDDAERSSAWVPAVGHAGRLTVAVHADRDPRRAAAARDACLRALDVPPPVRRREGLSGQGRVVLVGGGPGDPGLITVRARAALMSADLVIADRLAPLPLLDQLPVGVEVVDASKVPGGRAMAQQEINRRLVDGARAGRTVVRLKGGDPFVFGRGAEEVQACLDAGVPVEVVPGVSSATAVPGLAGIPVTHRGLTQGYTVVSGHVPPGDARSTVDWTALARTGTTLVLLMAVENLEAIAAALLAAGMDGEVPGACVTEGCSPRQRVVRAPLRDLAVAMRTAGVRSPAVIVIGKVAALGQNGEVPTTSEKAEYGIPGRDRRPRRVLVLGGARSGKSAAAEAMLSSDREVLYVATGPAGDDDPEWTERVRRHQARRPVTWQTTETRDLEVVLEPGEDPSPPTPVLIDCLSTWLSGVMDDCGIWAGLPDADKTLSMRIERLVAAWSRSPRSVVLVSSEVGLGVVPGTESGRRFRDELGALNARIAVEADEVWLCTAGLPRRLK